MPGDEELVTELGASDQHDKVLRNEPECGCRERFGLRRRRNSSDSENSVVGSSSNEQAEAGEVLDEVDDGGSGAAQSTVEEISEIENEASRRIDEIVFAEEVDDAEAGAQSPRSVNIVSESSDENSELENEAPRRINEIVSDDEDESGESKIKEIEIQALGGNGPGPGDATDVQHQRSQVYKMPSVQAATQDSFIFWPANFVILALTWQVKLLVFLSSTFFTVCTFGLAFARDPSQKTAELKQQLSEQVKPVAKDAAPRVASFLKKLAWGLLAVGYVVVTLTILVVPVVLFEYYYITGLMEEPVNIKAPIYFNYSEPRPSAAVQLVSLSRSSQELVPTTIKPFSWKKLQVEVTLVVPESDYNRELGMFQVTAELYTAKGDILARSSRPCMLKFQSAPIRHARTLIFSLPLLLDVSREHQTLHLKLIELNQDQLSQQQQWNPVTSAKVLIEPRAGFPPGGGLPEIYSADIHIRTKLPWKKSLLYNWKWTVYVWTAMGLFLSEISMVLCCFGRLLLPRSRKVRAEKFKPAVKSNRARNPSLVKKKVSFQE